MKLGLALAFAALVSACGSAHASNRPQPAPVAWAGPAGRVSLDAGWQVKLVRGDRFGRFTGRAVNLPYSPNARHITSLASYRGSIAWYKRIFSVAGGDYALGFASVNHRATVWIDGRLVARHTGAYLPFDARVSLARGIHTLVVRADWRDPDEMRDDGWFRSWFNFGGINREVTLRRLTGSELDAPGIVTKLVHGAAQVSVTVRVRNRSQARVIRVNGSLGQTPLRFDAVRVAPMRSAWVHAQVTIAHPDLWAPGHPALTALALSVPRETSYRALVGLRELRWNGERLYLNGRRLILRGASIQEDAPDVGDALSPAQMDAIVARLKAIGANATRAQHTLSEPLLERLDRAGILVWQAVGPFDVPGRWVETTKTAKRLAVRKVRLGVLENRLHPSVLAWNLANEVAFNGASHGQRHYVAAAAAEAKRLDPGRPVALDVWGTHLPTHPGAIYRSIDLVGATDYEGWYDDLYASAHVVEAEMRAWLARLHGLFPHKVLVVSEFGAEANQANPTDGPGGLSFQARRLAEHIRVYRADPRLTGMLAWSLQDFALRPNFLGGSARGEDRGLKLHRGLNAKGLFTYGGRPKPAAATVKRLFSG